jgi:hypothetical protein
MMDHHIGSQGDYFERVAAKCKLSQHFFLDLGRELSETLFLCCQLTRVMTHVHVYWDLQSVSEKGVLMIGPGDSHDLCCMVSMTTKFHASHLSCKFSAGQNNTKVYLCSPYSSIPKRVNYRVTIACVCYKHQAFW